MADYEPISRRPIAAAFRRTAEAATRLCVRWGIHPDAISYLSILAALGGAFCFWQSYTAPRLLIIAPVFCYLRLWFNMLDGMVALAAGKATARGEILNDLPDRISDIVIFVGVAHSGWMNPILGYWAAILAVLTAYGESSVKPSACNANLADGCRSLGGWWRFISERGRRLHAGGGTITRSDFRVSQFSIGPALS